MRVAVIAVIGFATMGGALAQTAPLAETPLGKRHCKVSEITKTDDTGRPLKKRDHYASEWTCQGFGGRQVVIGYGDQREGLAFVAGKAGTKEFLWPERMGSWGPTMEWRGSPSREADASLIAIARYSWDVGPPGGKPPRDKGAELAVLRVGTSQADSCILAWVDTQSTPNAVDLARTYADGEARTQKCVKDMEPRRLGKAK